jgi:hypothetical protein
MFCFPPFHYKTFVRHYKLMRPGFRQAIDIIGNIGLSSLDSSTEKAANPIGGTFLSRQNMKKLRTITEGCASSSFS